MNRNELIKRLKIASSLAGVIALAGCSTLEIAHSDLNCVLYPEKSLADRMSDEELNSMSDEVFNKVEIHIISYQERMNTQCEAIKKHNQLHGGN
jgi:hypothetical protein